MGYSENIQKRGFWQKGIFDIVNTFVTNFNSTLLKFDADTGDTDYYTAYKIISPSIGTTYDKEIVYNGMNQGDLVSLLNQFQTNFDAVMTATAADDGVAGTTVFTALAFGTDFLMEEPNAKIKTLGINQGDLAEWLDAALDKFNLYLYWMDEDTTLSDTDYATTYAIGDVIITSSSSSSSSSRSSSSSSSSSNSSSSSSSSSSRSSSSSSSSSRSSSSSSSSSRSSSSSSSSRSSSSSSSSLSSSSSSSRSSSSSSSSRSSSSSSSSSNSSSSSSSRSSSSSSSSSSRSSSSSSRSSSSSSSSRSSSSSSSSSSSLSSSSSSSSNASTS